MKHTSWKHNTQKILEHEPIEIDGVVVTRELHEMIASRPATVGELSSENIEALIDYLTPTPEVLE